MDSLKNVPERDKNLKFLFDFFGDSIALGRFVISSRANSLGVDWFDTLCRVVKSFEGVALFPSASLFFCSLKININTFLFVCQIMLCVICFSYCPSP